MVEYSETIDITIEERRQSAVFPIQMNIEALMARDVDVLELEPPMAYDAVRFISPTDLLVKQMRPQAFPTDTEWNDYAKARGGFPEIRYLNFTKSFKITVNPRCSVQLVIWADEWMESGQLLRSFGDTSVDASTVLAGLGIYDQLAESIQAFVLTGENQVIGLNVVLIEGDYIEYNAENGTWVVVASNEMVVSNQGVTFPNGINVASISASYSVPTQEQIDSGGLLDDPLTPDVDETVLPSSTTPYSDRLTRIKRELRFKNRGRKTIGGILFLVIGIGLVYFFTKSRIFNTVKEEVTTGIEGVGEVV